MASTSGEASAAVRLRVIAARANNSYADSVAAGSPAPPAWQLAN